MGQQQFVIGVIITADDETGQVTIENAKDIAVLQYMDVQSVTNIVGTLQKNLADISSFALELDYQAQQEQRKEQEQQQEAPQNEEKPKKQKLSDHEASKSQRGNHDNKK